MINWDELVDRLASMSINAECADEDGHTVTVAEAIRIELKPVQDEIERLQLIRQVAEELYVQHKEFSAFRRFPAPSTVKLFLALKIVKAKEGEETAAQPEVPEFRQLMDEWRRLKEGKKVTAKRKPGVPSRKQMYEILRARSLDIQCSRIEGGE